MQTVFILLVVCRGLSADVQVGPETRSSVCLHSFPHFPGSPHGDISDVRVTLGVTCPTNLIVFGGVRTGFQTRRPVFRQLGATLENLL